jgi:predicted amidohydrolase YtcJ
LAYQLGLSTAEAHDAESDLILTNGRFATLDRSNPNAEAVAIKDGRFSAVAHAKRLGSYVQSRPSTCVVTPSFRV